MNLLRNLAAFLRMLWGELRPSTAVDAPVDELQARRTRTGDDR
jgi:hypothetical protein